MKLSIQLLLVAALAVLFLGSCQQPGKNQTGSEFVPDMAHSLAYESNVYSDFTYNSFDDQSVVSKKELSNPKLPVQGTIPRGYAGFELARTESAGQDVLNVLAGKDSPNSLSVPPNGSAPYFYTDTEDERTRASMEIIDNPFPITENGLARGKELYNIFCGICHGEKGDGLGYLVRDGGKYPAAPANFLQDTFYKSTNGRFYHSIMYGKNVMGAYKDKISYEERWQVIHWIRALQAKELKVEYTSTENTLNASFGTPAAKVQAMKSIDEAVETAIDGQLSQLAD